MCHFVELCLKKDHSERPDSVSLVCFFIFIRELSNSWVIYTSLESFIWDMTHSERLDSVSPEFFFCKYENCFIRGLFVWDVTRSYETWLAHMRHDSLVWDMTRSYETWLAHMRHDSLIWDMTRSYETWLAHLRHDSLIWDMTRSERLDPLSLVSFLVKYESCLIWGGFIRVMAHLYDTWLTQSGLMSLACCFFF